MKPAAMKTPKLDAFDAMLTAFRAIYDAEIGRLADRYRARILDGEFSGDTPPPNDGPRFLALAEELEKTHPWLSTQRKRIMVVAASHWLEAEDAAMTDPRTGDRLGEAVQHEQGDTAAECMMRDILAVAADLGWVKPMRYVNDDEPYELRVRKGRAA